MHLQGGDPDIARRSSVDGRHVRRHANPSTSRTGSPVESCRALLTKILDELSGARKVAPGGTRPRANKDDLDGWFSTRQLAERAGVTEEEMDRFTARLRRSLSAFRNGDRTGKYWSEREGRGPRDEVFLYRGSAVQPIIDGLFRSKTRRRSRT
jgi:hypothetical protein